MLTSCMYVHGQAVSSMPQGLSRGDWHVGTTKVFLRSNSHRLSLDRLKVGRLSTYILRLQAFGRRFLQFLRVSSHPFEVFPYMDVCIYVYCMNAHTYSE